MSTYSMSTPCGRFEVAPTKLGTEDTMVTVAVTDFRADDRPQTYFDLDPVEARAHAQHLLSVADEVERLRKKVERLRKREGTP